ncbi:MAG: NERD domain-containing protein, partial [Oscillibacter sp.]|nr:NERD domain-containing protein [Oscillibacter sp.]
NHQVLRNLYVPYKGRTAEIDLVMAHEKGIFVFESKNYSGRIFGSAKQEQWTQSLPNGEKHSFYNPILQNAAHIAALSEYLKIPRTEFFSYIVFSERCSLKKTPPNTPSAVILKRDALSENLNAVLSVLPPIYNEAVVQSIADILRPLAVRDKETKAKHVETARAAKERAQNSSVCPLCGGTLIKRRGRYGEFWGCSSYPNCRFTRNIERD